MTRSLSGIFAIALAIAADPALARQEIVGAAVDSPDQSAQIETYSPAYFEQFQPNTALDMVSRIPGFILRSGDGERGFGEATTNILINGRRPSTKSQSANDILSRIPAGTVIRIEVLDGASLDIPGLSGQVVNIVAKAVELSGNWRYAMRFEEGTEPQLLEGEITLSGKRGDLAFSLGLESGHFTFTEDSVEQFIAADGSILEDRTEDVYLRNLGPSANLNLTWTPSEGSMAGHVANLNLSIEDENDANGVRETFIARDPSRNSGRSFADTGSDEVEYEIGGDYALPLTLGNLDGTLKLIGLTRSEDEVRRTIFVNAFDGATPTRTIFSRDQREGETIGRLEYGFSAGDDHDIQISTEYAYNFLDATTRFEDNFTAPIFDPVRVEEDRYNLRLTDSWEINPDLSLQSSIGAEYSVLQVVNPLSEAREFFRPKGFAALSYQLSERYAVRPRVERSVGQLDFGTFVSTRNIIDNLITSGNGEIKPSQSWEASIELERIDDQLLSGSIIPFYERIEDPIDRILFPDGTEGPGNLDSAVRYGVDANATLLFDTLGAPGLRLEWTGGLRDSRIDDPLTGERRQINFNTEYYFDATVRYDIPDSNIALTTRIYNDQQSPFFRLDEEREVRVDKPYLSVGLIHKNVFGMQISITGTNLLDNTIIQERQRYLGANRRLGPLSRIERFERDRGRRLSIVISDTF